MAMTLISQIDADPLFYGDTILRRRRWSGQRRMVRAMRQHRRVRFQSGNATGKTNELAAAVIEFLTSAENRKALLGGPSYDQVHNGIWGEIVRTWDARLAEGVRLSRNRPGEREWKLGNGSKAFITSPENISSVQGGRGGSGTMIVIDEAQGVQDAALWDAYESLMQHPASRLFTACNPLYPEGVDFENSMSDLWTTVTLDCLAHPNVVTSKMVIPGAVSRQWVDEVRKKWGEDDPRYIARVLGQYPTAGTNSLFSIGLIDRAMMNTPTVRKGRHIGVDIAGEDGDMNVAYLCVDNRIEAFEEWTGLDLMGTTGRIVQLAGKWSVPFENIHVDATGIGEGVPARLREMGHTVDAVKFSESPAGDWGELLAYQTALNRRVEMYLVAAQLLRDGQLNIPARFVTARKDLCATNLIAPHSSGASRLEEKKAIKKRLGRSPDHGDALVLSLCQTNTLTFVSWS